MIGAALPEAQVAGLRAGGARAAGVDEATSRSSSSARSGSPSSTAHRGKEGPTDVLSFPVDERHSRPGPRELGDVVICPEHTRGPARGGRARRAAPLTGMDHETDDGEMLALQAEIRSWLA